MMKYVKALFMIIGGIAIIVVTVDFITKRFISPNYLVMFTSDLEIPSDAKYDDEKAPFTGTIKKGTKCLQYLQKGTHHYLTCHVLIRDDVVERVAK